MEDSKFFVKSPNDSSFFRQNRNKTILPIFKNSPNFNNTINPVNKTIPIIGPSGKIVNIPFDKPLDNLVRPLDRFI